MSQRLSLDEANWRAAQRKHDSLETSPTVGQPCQCRNKTCYCGGDCRELADDHGTVFWTKWRCARCDIADQQDYEIENQERK